MATSELLYVLKAVHGMVPAYVSEIIAVPQAPRSLRSNNKLLLIVLRTHLKLKGDRAFAVAGPKLWNSLPQVLREVSSLKAFKVGQKLLLVFSLWECVLVFSISRMCVVLSYVLMSVSWLYSTLVCRCSFKVLYK